MAVFSVEIADADVNRVLTAIAANYSRPDQVANPAYATIENPNFDPAIEENEDTNPRFVSNGEPATIDNPETVPQFANRIVRQLLSEHVQAHEIRAAKQAAADAVDTSVNISDPQA